MYMKSVLFTACAASLSIFAVIFSAGMGASSAAEPAGAKKTTSEIVVTATRIGSEVPGTSTTIITEDDIEASPAQTVPDLLSYFAGIQTRDLFGGVGAARSIVDIRGFGATAVSNTLILVNGRRLNDIDMAAIDWANTPIENIERIEIIRGNSGAVLYGDGAVGGVVNIVTRSPLVSESMADFTASVGNLGQDAGTISVVQRIGRNAFSLYGNISAGDGYRDNNDIHQKNAFFELRRDLGAGEVYLNLTADDQSLGLPGVRRITQDINEEESDRRGADTPSDHAEQNGLSGTLGGTWSLKDGVEVILDGGVRHKNQDAEYFDSFDDNYNSYVDTALTNWSLTPRVSMQGQSLRTVAGLDYYHAKYTSYRKNNISAPAVKRYRGTQQSVGLYGQSTGSLSKRLEAHIGGRLQWVGTKAVDTLNTEAPGYTASNSTHKDFENLDLSQFHFSASAGIDHEIVDNVDVFVRAARSFRLPTIDDRIGTGSATFDLKAQTSYDLETGIRARIAGGKFTASTYVMNLENEIAYNAEKFVNLNLDPTRRYGAEAAFAVSVTRDLALSFTGAHTRAIFRSGANKGNDVPLVSAWTGSAGATWSVADWLQITAEARYVGEKRFDNDAKNVQPKIPSYTLVDLRLGGSWRRFTWEAVISNLFAEKYFNYGVASAFTLGNYNVYPLPERTVLFRLGANF